MTTVTESMGLTAEQVQRALQRAVLAPSVHNTQPWLFRVLPDRIEIHADLSRQLPAADPDGRELRISVGAVATTLGLALEDERLRPVATIRPKDSSRAEVVIRGAGHAPLPEAQSPLVRAIAQRHTNRRPFLDTIVPVEQRRMLTRAAQQDLCWLEELREPARRAQLRDIIKNAHRHQQEDSAYLAEWSKWTGRLNVTTDGVPLRVAGPTPQGQDLWVLRDFGQSEFTEREVPRVEGKDFESEPLILVLATHTDGPAAQVRAGMALQRVLLTATSLGLASSFISQPIEVPAQHAALQRLLGGGLRPQAVLRVGFGSPVAASPRRAIELSLMDPAAMPTSL